VEFELESISRFYKHLKAVKSDRTAKSYSASAQKFEEYLESAGVDLEEATPGVLDDFVMYLSDSNLQPASIRLFTIGAKKYVEFLRKSGMPIPAVDKADLPKVERKPVMSLTERQLRAFFVVADREALDPCRTILKLLPLCGLRVGEICDLKLSNVSKIGGVIHFSFNGKGGKLRSVPLEKTGSGFLVEYLSGWRRGCRDRTYLFPESETAKKQISTRSVQQNVQNAREMLGIEFLTPHTLRKTYATMLIDRGVSLPVVSNLLGHSSVDTSLQHYIEIRGKQKVEAVSRLGGTDG
jgi:site-specific recombinase XerD